MPIAAIARALLNGEHAGLFQSSGPVAVSDAAVRIDPFEASSSSSGARSSTAKTSAGRCARWPSRTARASLRSTARAAPGSRIRTLLTSHVAEPINIVPRIDDVAPGGLRALKIDLRTYLPTLPVDRVRTAIVVKLLMDLGIIDYADRSPRPGSARDHHAGGDDRREAAETPTQQWWLFFDSIDSLVTVKQGEVDELIHALIDLADDDLRRAAADRARGPRGRAVRVRAHRRVGQSATTRSASLAATSTPGCAAGRGGEPPIDEARLDAKLAELFPSPARCRSRAASRGTSRCASCRGADAVIGPQDGARSLAEGGRARRRARRVRAGRAPRGPWRRLIRHGLHGPRQADDVLRLLCERLPSRGRNARRAPAHRRARRGCSSAAVVPELARVRAAAASRLVTDGPLQRMLDAFVLGGGPMLDERDEDELLASLTVWRGRPRPSHSPADARALDRARTRTQIESRLALLDVTRAVRRLAGGGCVGREAELARLHEYRRSTPLPYADLQAEPAMVLYGLGGVGKSTLVARFVMDLLEERPGSGHRSVGLSRPRPTHARFVRRPDVLVADINRQVAAQLVADRRSLVRSEEILRRRQKGAGLEAADDA